MALINRPATPAAQAAQDVRRGAERLVTGVRVSLREMRRITARVGRANLAAALGSADAAELAALYASAKAVIVAAGETVEDLPA